MIFHKNRFEFSKLNVFGVEKFGIHGKPAAQLRRLKISMPSFTQPQPKFKFIGTRTIPVGRRIGRFV